jgi:anaerobic magnesium-protoporphyrin IX monomethyl ester cyclase
MGKIKSILFLNPPDPALLDQGNRIGYSYFEPPIGLLYVYSYMRARKHFSTGFVDLSLELKYRSHGTLTETLVSLLEQRRPDLVALSALYYTSIPIFHDIARIIKGYNKEIVTVFGGHYPTHLTEKCMADENVDFAVISEGEIGFSDLMDVLNGAKEKEEVEGIVYRQNGDIVKIERKHFWKGYSESPRLPWEHTDFEHYFKNSRHVLHRLKEKNSLKMAAITSTRGCPNNCSFCSSPNFWKRRWRKRKVSHVIDEIKFLKRKYGVNTVIFNDENMTANRAWFLELLKEIKKLNITWIAGSGLSIRSINGEEVIRSMYESGIGLFNLAIESSTDRNLKRIKKNLTVEETENVIGLIRTLGDAFITGFFITGFPWETLSDVKYTLEYAEKLDLDWKCFYCFQPFPGCELFDHCIQNGLMTAFNTDYGENYFAPDFKHIDYSAEELGRISYLANLKCNFVENRNLKLGTDASLVQAERDFKYVLEMVEGHVFALNGLARIMHLREDYEQESEYIRKAREHLGKDEFDWGYYLKRLGIDH